jgi:LysM repeat protein
MIRGLILLFICTVYFNPSFAHNTGDSTAYLTLRDTIFISLGAYQEKIFEHGIERKQTLFSLAKFYGLTLGELYAYNPGLKEKGTSVGDKIRIPIPNRAIKRYRDAGFSYQDYVPVYYIVRKGDTMYGISKRIFRMPEEEIWNRNHLLSNSLKPGQKLHVGWMSLYGIPDTLRTFRGGPLAQKNYALKKIHQRNSFNKKEYKNQGVAFWQKDNKDDSDFYALHRKAPINSIIAITNPMKNRTAYAKVIGRIPATAYGNDVAVVISPLTAKFLGAKDPRFFVKVKYFK